MPHCARNAPSPCAAGCHLNIPLPTCVCCVGMEDRVGVGDKLQLPVEVVQLGSGHSEMHFPLPFHLDPVHFSSYVQGAQSSCQIDLPE